VTKNFVQGSAKYQALPATQRALIDLTTNALCQRLALVVPTLTPLQRSALLGVYKVGVTALVPLGWITAVQASTLTSLADKL
jgi:hypothetical protein